MDRSHPLYLVVVIIAAILLEWILAKRLHRTLNKTPTHTNMSTTVKTKRNRGGKIPRS